MTRSLVALLCATGGAILAFLVVASATLSSLDLAISRGIYSLRSDWLDTVLIIATSMVDARALIITDVLIVLLLLLVGRLRLASAGAAVLIGCAVSVQLIKSLVERARPMAELYDGISAFSFPSGHAANAMAMLLVLMGLFRYTLSPRAFRMSALVLVLFALAIGISRIYLLAHWPSDVVAGYLLAIAVAAAGSFMLNDQEPGLHPRLPWVATTIWLVIGSLYTWFAFNVQRIMYVL